MSAHTLVKSPKHPKDYYLDYIRAEDRPEEVVADSIPPELHKLESE
jgi:hypothetical protein